jgi:hypothetical protein
MKALSTTVLQKSTLIMVLTDLGALAFIFLVPAISHLTSMPVYLIEPMRLMLILALVHTTKNNAYLLAFALPLFSMILSGHPAFPKMVLIAFELSLNVFLFYVLVRRLKSVFPAILGSIILSKALYYLLKFMLISFAVIQTELISTPIVVQLITTLIFSSYLFVFYKRT